MSKLEYMVGIACFLGTLKGEDYALDIEGLDIEDLTTLCGAILSDYYNQNEAVYLNEFLQELGEHYLTQKFEDLFGY